jgi:hypothetical protein
MRDIDEVRVSARVGVSGRVRVRVRVRRHRRDILML